MSGRHPLPSRLLIVTDRHQAAAPLAGIVRDAIEAGARWVWLRDRDLPTAARRALAAELLAVTRPAGAKLMIGAGIDVDLELAADVGADGVHLASDASAASIAAVRARLGAAAIIGISAHAEVDAASAR